VLVRARGHGLELLLPIVVEVARHELADPYEACGAATVAAAREPIPDVVLELRG
jgi:hypothetical protein